MTWTMAIFTYINLWWVSLFFTWPFSVEARDPGEPVTPGDYAAAPKRIFWKKMLIGASVLSAVFTASIAAIIQIIK